jgi:T4-like virus tail tube protein gp19
MRVTIRAMHGRVVGVLSCLAVLSLAAGAGASSLPTATSSPRYVLQVQGGGGEWAFSQLLSLRPASSHRLASVTLRGPVTPAWSGLYTWLAAQKQGQPNAQMTATLEVFKAGAQAKPVATYTLTRARPAKLSVKMLSAGATKTAMGTVIFKATSIVRGKLKPAPTTAVRAKA